MHRWHSVVTHLPIALAITAILTINTEASARDWKSKDGKQTVTASLVSCDGESARLLKSNGKEITVPVASLCTADQAFLADHVASARDTPTGPAETTDPTQVAGDPRDILQAKGVRVTSSDLMLLREPELSKGIQSGGRLRKQLSIASKKLEAAMGAQRKLKHGIAQLRRQNVVYNSELVKARTVVVNNKLVGALNANQEKIALANQQLENMGEQVTKIRGEVSVAREAYLQHVLDLRKLADELQQLLDGMSQDAAAIAAVKALNAASGKEYAFVPSRQMRGYLKKLTTIEDSVLSESIPLRRERSGTLYVSTVVNGDKPREMVLDSGASLTSLPRDVATAMGIYVKDSDPDINLVLADGRQIRAKMVRLASIRVGKFQVEDVDAAVLGPEATNAEPLLGMSFLDQFKFEINAAESKLTMVKIETSNQ